LQSGLLLYQRVLKKDQLRHVVHQQTKTVEHIHLLFGFAVGNTFTDDLLGKVFKL
jgi:hypothetical protein